MRSHRTPACACLWLALGLCLGLLMPARGLAFERLSLQLAEPDPAADVSRTFLEPPRPGQKQVVGRVADSRFAVPGSRHLALFDAAGNRLPLWIDRASLVYRGDQIIAATLGFEVPENTPRRAQFSLVWSDREEIGPDNQETAFAPPRSQGPYTFELQPAAANPSATVIVEVDSRRPWYQAWYLFPLLAALMLGWLGWGVRHES